jgi:Flp pilus assembly protein TadD
LPPKEKAKVNLATAQMMDRDGRIPEAIALYERARAINPEHGHVCRRLAVLYDRLGNFAKANEEYEKALAMFPQDSALLNDAGYCHFMQGDLSLAENYLRQSIELKPDNKRAWTNLGMTLAMRERIDEALEAFMHSVPEPQARCHLAFAFTVQGKRQEAMDEYRKALQLAPDLELARQALAKLENPHPPTTEKELPLQPGNGNAVQAEMKTVTEFSTLTSNSPSLEKKPIEGFATQRDE